MKEKDFSKMSNKELVRVRTGELSNVKMDSYFREVSDRRRRMKAQISEFDDVLRLLNVERYRG